MYAGNQESLGHASHERKWLQEDQVRLQRNPEIKGRVCVCVCVWEEDRLPTCKWLAIIRRSVTRGYVRQLKLCFLTET